MLLRCIVSRPLIGCGGSCNIYLFVYQVDGSLNRFVQALHELESSHNSVVLSSYIINHLANIKDLKQICLLKVNVNILAMLVTWIV